jgi:hypothetical protein
MFAEIVRMSTLANTIRLLIVFMFIALMIGAGISYEIFRWHTFQELTHSDIGYWKWQFLYGGKK